jgi:protoheme IX farnesyltransferase
MVAELIGLLTIILVVWFWRSESRRWMKALALGALATVVLQGVLGGLTVLHFLPPAISSAHAAVAQTFFCLICAIAVFTGRHWVERDVSAAPPGRRELASARHPPLLTLALLSIALLYVQLLLGAMFRHHGLSWWPHLLNAPLVALLLTWTAVRALSDYSAIASIRRSSIAVLALLIAQLFLGFAAFLTRVEWGRDAAQPELPMVISTVAHVAVGALLLAATVVLTLQLWRHIASPQTQPLPAGSPRPSAAIAPVREPGVVRTRLATSFLRDLAELTKVRVTALIIVTAWCGYYFGALRSAVSSLSFGMLQALLGIGVVSAGAAALNEVLERKIDSRMRRTARRPLPSGRMKLATAVALGAGMTLGGSIYLGLALNALTGWLALATAGVYLAAYTPLKKVHPLCTLVGAVPGAMPGLLGWTAARGRIDLGALVMFAIVFFWQFPHFFSIAWLYREDYQAGGILMLPVVEPDGRSTARQILLYSLGLIPVSLLPTFLGMAGRPYFFGALLMGTALFYVSLRLATSRLALAATESKQRARQLLRATVLYLPLLFALMMLNPVSS